MLQVFDFVTEAPGLKLRDEPWEVLPWPWPNGHPACSLPGCCWALGSPHGAASEFLTTGSARPQDSDPAWRVLWPPLASSRTPKNPLGLHPGFPPPAGALGMVWEEVQHEGPVLGSGMASSFRDGGVWVVHGSVPSSPTPALQELPLLEKRCNPALPRYTPRTRGGGTEGQHSGPRLTTPLGHFILVLPVVS